MTINWQNIQFSREYAFEPLPLSFWKNLNVPYDTYSVMHFGSKQLGRYGEWTIVRNDGTEIIPNRVRPTSLDIQKICKAYGEGGYFLIFNQIKCFEILNFAHST